MHSYISIQMESPIPFKQLLVKQIPFNIPVGHGDFIVS